MIRPQPVFAVFMLAAAGCKTQPPDVEAPKPAIEPASSALALETGDGPEARYLTACTASCERARSMKAVAWEMIQAECNNGCAADWRLPLVENGTELARRDRERIRVRGRLFFPATSDPVLEMGGGTKLILHLDPPAPPEGSIVAVGTVAVERGVPHLEGVIAVPAD